MATDTYKPSDPPLWWRMIIGRHPRRTLLRVVLLAVGSWLFFTQVILNIRVEGISMEPTYHNGSVNAINKLAYWRTAPSRGDVVGIRMTGQHVMLMKRIIGLPGERVSIRHGVVYINDEPLEEPYLAHRARWNRKEVLLQPNEYLVIGDNRGMAIEDHVMGEVDIHRIVGKVIR
jgi:signal peptidase I